jgi:hypothetical protein
MVLDAIERVFEELEGIANPRELTLLALAVVMVAYGAFLESTETASVALIVVGSGMFFIGIFLPVLTEFQIGPSGFSATLRERDREVQAALEPHTESLMQTASLLAGNPEAGRELLEKALIDTYLQWHEAKQVGPVDAVRSRLDNLAPPVGEGAPGTAVEIP